MLKAKASRGIEIFIDRMAKASSFSEPSEDRVAADGEDSTARRAALSHSSLHVDITPHIASQDDSSQCVSIEGDEEADDACIDAHVAQHEEDPAVEEAGEGSTE
eukprot:16348804-Heterocapsa_arctica.AAC.1